MISLETKTESTSSTPLTTSKQEGEPTVPFSKHLDAKKEAIPAKEIQNGSFVVSLDLKDIEIKDLTPSNKKEETLLSLLKSDEKVLVEDEIKDFNPQIVSKLPDVELKSLIKDSKQFLKEQILNSDGYKRAEVKDLPKTLNGLVKMAKKFGIDVSKITLQEVKPTISIVKEIKKETIKPITQTITKEITKEVLADDIIEVKLPKTKTAKVSKDIVKEIKQDETTKIAVNLNDKEVRVTKTKEIQATPLFKAQTSTEHTTEQFVQTKQFKLEEKTPKSKADETLKLLLRGEKPSMTNPNLTADFSVATAKVIAPSAKSEIDKSLENLLHGDSKEKEINPKTEGITIHKADSFEVKLNEAKQMIKYLSQDVKTAIEDYKSPFTRVKVQLNPQKLGEVDVTIIQRGKNLHVNISSNNTAINTLSMNANELKAQLNNSGINNATLNFNNSSQNSEQNGSQQNRQKEQQANEEYNYFDKDEQNEEILSSLEIVVPNYA